ncbi:MAG: hypothetical protein NVS1B2_25760 [Vulcanimicrobiaceae bacterium]
MDVARELLARARDCGAASIAVVGTSKNAGKSVVVAALAARLAGTSESFALVTLGNDGEAFDALVGAPKPRFFLRPGAIVATATCLLSRSPAVDVLDVTAERCALGPIAIVRVRTATFLEIAGPPQASALRRIVARLHELAPVVIIDGAVDRIAALRDGGDAIVVAVGAAGGSTMAAAAEDAAALVARLRLPPVGDARDAVVVRGALTARAAADHARTYGRRPLVVADPTRIAFGGRALLDALERLDLRSARVLRPIACTVAPIGPERSFPPRAFARAVAERTGLPTYDVYAQLVA